MFYNRVSEPTFWKNYFYRVTLAKQAVLSNPPTEPVKSTNQDVLFDFKDEDDEEEEKENVNEPINRKSTKEDNNSEIKQDKTIETVADPSPIITATTTTTKKEENYEGMEDWEIELRKAAI